jgi:hypothetical protein
MKSKNSKQGKCFRPKYSLILRGKLPHIGDFTMGGICNPPFGNAYNLKAKGNSKQLLIICAAAIK